MKGLGSGTSLEGGGGARATAGKQSHKVRVEGEEQARAEESKVEVGALGVVELGRGVLRLDGEAC